MDQICQTCGVSIDNVSLFDPPPPSWHWPIRKRCWLLSIYIYKYPFWSRNSTGLQILSLGSGCYSKGVIIHKIFYTQGFQHEQSWPDRDYYVEIIFGKSLCQKTTLSAPSKFITYSLVFIYQICCTVVPTSPVQSWYNNIVATLCHQHLCCRMHDLTKPFGQFRYSTMLVPHAPIATLFKSICSQYAVNEYLISYANIGKGKGGIYSYLWFLINSRKYFFKSTRKCFVNDCRYSR